MTDNDTELTYYRSKEITGSSPMAPFIQWIVEYPDGSRERWDEVLSAYPHRSNYDPDAENVDMDEFREVDVSEVPDEVRSEPSK